MLVSRQMYVCRITTVIEFARFDTKAAVVTLAIHGVPFICGLD